MNNPNAGQFPTVAEIDIFIFGLGVMLIVYTAARIRQNALPIGRRAVLQDHAAQGVGIVWLLGGLLLCVPGILLILNIPYDEQVVGPISRLVAFALIVLCVIFVFVVDVAITLGQHFRKRDQIRLLQDALNRKSKRKNTQG